MSSHSQLFFHPKIAMMATQCFEEGRYVLGQYSESEKLTKTQRAQ